MKISLSHFSLFSPDEILAHWWVSHDFAGTLGLEYSRDAAKALKRIVASRGVRIDYEADEVSLSITRKENVIPVLAAIYSSVGWDPSELKAIEGEILAFKRPRPRPVAIGDTFLVPIKNDIYGLGQVIDLCHKSPTVAVFKCIGSAGALESHNPASFEVLTILHIGGSSLYKGEWPIVASHTVQNDPSSGPGGKNGTVGSRSYGGDGPIVELLAAHAGLQTWEQGYHDPNYLRKLVMG